MALPDMREGRSGFNACLFSGYIYVCERHSSVLCGSLLVEAFCPQADTFFPLPLQLPEDSYCCLYVHNSLLVVYSEPLICVHLPVHCRRSGPTHPTLSSQVYTCGQVLQLPTCSRPSSRSFLPLSKVISVSTWKSSLS